MTNEQFLFTLFCTVSFCLGLRIASDGNYKENYGQILYFLKKPFDVAYDRLEMYENKEKVFPNKYYKHLIYINKTIATIGKPFITCITCMASIWGITVFVTLNGFTSELIPYLIINCFSASFINTFIWSLYAKYIQ